MSIQFNLSLTALLKLTAGEKKKLQKRFLNKYTTTNFFKSFGNLKKCASHIFMHTTYMNPNDLYNL